MKNFLVGGAVIALGMMMQSALAQVTFELEQNVAAVPDGSTTATMDVNWSNDLTIGAGGIASLQLELTLPEGVSVAGCVPAQIPGTDHFVSPCDQNTGPGSFTIALLDNVAALGPTNEPIPDGTPLFQIEFTVASGTSPGTLPIGFTDFSDQNLNTMGDTEANEFVIQPGTNFNGTEGSLLVEVPAGESFYSSTPAVDSNVDLGSAVVNSPAGAVNVTVSNLQDDGASDFAIDGATGTNGGATIVGTVPGGTETVPADGGNTTVNVAFECTPLARGTQMGMLAISNDSDNQGPSAGYEYSCKGLTPNVEAPASVSISGPVAPDAAPTANLIVSNNDPGDNATSQANNVTVTITSDPDSVFSVNTGTQNIPVDESRAFEIECDNTTTTDSTGQATVEYDDPDSGGTASTPVNLTCSVTDTEPLYESDPAPDDPLPTMTADFGNTSAAVGVDVYNGNSNEQAESLQINSAVASDPIFDVTVITGTFPPNQGPDGENDIEVTCTPAGVGTINGMLTVDSNDGIQEYPLTCVGTGDELTTTPPDGGTLNLGTVPPGTTTGEGLITFTNNSLDQSINVSCSVNNDPEGVFTSTPDSIVFTLAPGLSEEVRFQGTPPDISTFTADVECSNGILGRGLNGPFFKVTVSGRPLVIPTMSRWGLVVMSLVLLLVGGFATRRMMA